MSDEKKMVRAFTQALFFITGKMGGRGFGYRGLIRRYTFVWNPAKRRHEYGPLSVEDFNECRKDILESNYSTVRPSVELCGEILVDAELAADVPKATPFSHEKVPTSVRASQVARSEVFAGINPLLVPDVVTQEVIDQMQGEKPVLDERFDPAPLTVPPAVAPVEQPPEPTFEPPQDAEEEEEPVQEDAPVVEPVEQEEAPAPVQPPVEEPAAADVEPSSAAPVVQECEPVSETIHTKQSLRALNVEQQYAILTEWDVPNRGKLKGKESALIAKILEVQAKRLKG